MSTISLSIGRVNFNDCYLTAGQSASATEIYLSKTKHAQQPSPPLAPGPFHKVPASRL